VKTIVEAPGLKVEAGAGTITISWPLDAANYVLESADNLHAPVAWTQLTDPPPQINSGIKSVTLGTTNVSRFFRLRAPTP
jgi:hypothetical protein